MAKDFERILDIVINTLGLIGVGIIMVAFYITVRSLV